MRAVEPPRQSSSTARIASTPETYVGQVVIKREILPDGRHKLILKDPSSGDFTDRVVAGGGVRVLRYRGSTDQPITS